MDLTTSERFIILLLCDVARKLQNPRESIEMDPDFITEAVTGGHLWALDWQYGPALESRADNPRRVHDVVNILDMWDFVERGRERLTAEEIEKMDADLKSPPTKTFLGFDANTEGMEFGIAHFLVRKMGRFRRFENRELNSHLPLFDRYHRMAKLFEEIRPKLGDRPLTADEISEILQAGASTATRG